MRVFVVRPFGEKEGIDFERVDRELIQPALVRLGTQGIHVVGGTTAEINRAGNIREDMFRLLVVADLVIADVSIHNANVFYELGIRHALRPRHTFMIRSDDHAQVSVRPADRPLPALRSGQPGGPERHDGGRTRVGAALDARGRAAEQPGLPAAARVEAARPPEPGRVCRAISPKTWSGHGRTSSSAICGSLRRRSWDSSGTRRGCG